MSKVIFTTDTISEIRLSSDDKLIAVNNGEYLTLCYLESGESIFEMKLDEDIESFEFTRDGKYLFFSDGISSYSLSLQDLELVDFFALKNPKIDIDTDEIERLTLLESSYNGNLIFSHPNGYIYLFYLNQNHLKCILNINQQDISINARFIDKQHKQICLTANLIWLPDRLCTLNSDDFDGQKLPKFMPIERWEEGRFLGTSSNYDYLISKDKTIILKNIQNEIQTIHALDINLSTFATDNELHSLAVAVHGGIKIFDLHTGNEINNIDTGSLSPISISFLNRKDVKNDIIACFANGKVTLYSA
jgi:WD40 repeat protein